MRSPGPRFWLADFFQHDPDRALAAWKRVEAESGGAVMSTDVFVRGGVGDRKGAPEGIFAPEIFGTDPERFGHVSTVGVLHPAVLTTLEVELGLSREEITRIALGEERLGEDEPADLPGVRALANALRKKKPDHPYLPLCAMTRIPVPPTAARPMRHTKKRPELVDPWIGPENEAWVVLVQRARREQRLDEMGDVPPVILAVESAMVQRLFSNVFEQTHHAYASFLPALEKGIDDEFRTLCFVGGDRLLVQHGDGVRLVDFEGREIRRYAPAPCRLSGVVDGRYAVFTRIDDGLHPYFCDDTSLWPSWLLTVDAEGCRDVRPFRELNILDLESGQHLFTRPAAVPDTFPEKGEPEELFFRGRPLFVGGDRPSALCYTHDMQFVLVGENDDTQILELETGIPAAYPNYAYDATTAIDLATGESGEATYGVGDFGGGVAIAFADGVWRILQQEGVLSDHRGRDPILLEPPPSSAAFDPSGRLLAVVFTARPEEDDAEASPSAQTIAIVDASSRTVVARFPAR